MRWGHFLQTAFTSLARWFVKTNTLPIFSGRLHLLHTWRCPSIFNDSGNTKDGSSVIWWNPWFLPSVQVINLPLQELPALHGGFPCPCVHILTLKRFAKNVFRTWGSSQGSLSGTQTNRPGEHTAPFISPSHLQTSPYLWCVFNTSKGLWEVCICSLYGPGEDAAASHTAAAGMGIWVLGGGAGVLSSVHLLSLTKNCLSSRHVPHVQVRSSPLNTPISLDGMWRSCFFLSFGITCSEEGLHVQEGGSILLRRKRTKP